VAPFRIRIDARDWFRDLRDVEKSFRTDFDAFYFCFIAGVSSGQKQSATSAETAELVDNFPDRYGGRGKLLVALFLAQELHEFGILVQDKRAVHTAVARLVNPTAPNHLSDEGVRQFNKYAHGGFDVLLDWFDDRPRSLDSFLRLFKRRMDSVLETSVDMSSKAL
jgi:hypothetical protein